jgi:hypothetical protein
MPARRLSMRKIRVLYQASVVELKTSSKGLAKTDQD